ncbi:MAG: hypothetical protein EOP85_05275 [Verrucomicrobiaceae bacterium]|nr:MAG: hypothetical protein EOP85_05275 [Verrucomicrobiaceae bacterium]
MKSGSGLRKKWLPALLVFTTGLPLGWLLRDRDHSNILKDSGFSAKPIPKHGDAAKPPADEHWNEFARKIGRAEGPDWGQMWTDLPPVDRPAAIRAMIELSGASQWEQRHQLRERMKGILNEWAGDDLDGALSAARDTSNMELRDFMIGWIKKYLVGKDFDRLLALDAEFPERYTRFGIPMVHQGLIATLEQGAAEYIAALEKAPHSGGTGIQGKFAADFDFRFAADRMAEMIQFHEHPHYLICPTNFLEEWAKRDPDAAFSWWAAKGPLPWSNLRDLILIQESNSPENAAVWLAAKIQQAPANRENIIRELGRDYPEVLTNRINAVARAMPDTAAGDAFLTDFLRYNTTPDLDRQYPMGFVFSSMSSPEVRIAAIHAVRENGGAFRVDQLTDEQLASWGISRELVMGILTGDAQ